MVSNIFILGSNQIGDSGTKELAIALMSNNHLKSLIMGNPFISIEHNNIENEGAISLANALKENLSLTIVDLSIVEVS